MTLDIWIALVALVAMSVGEAWRISGAGLTRDAPLSQATAVALGMSTAWPRDPAEPEAVIGLAGPLALATMAVLLVSAVRRAPGTLLPDLVRLWSSLLVAGLLVRVPGVFGPTLLDRAGRPDSRPVLIAFLLLLVAILAVATPLVVRALATAVRRGTRPSAQLREDIGIHGPLALGTATIATVMTIALDVMGPSGLVLFLVPLVVLQPAVSRQHEIGLAQRQTVSALARLTEESGLTAQGHSARVAALAVPVARDLGVADSDLSDVEAVALLHDIGQVGLHRPIPGGATVEVSARDQRRIAATGAAILARTAELSRLSAMVADVGVPHYRALERGDVTLTSRVVRVASAYDDLTGRSTRLDGADGPVEAADRLLRNSPHDYDPAVVDALVHHLERRGVLSVRQVAALRR